MNNHMKHYLSFAAALLACAALANASLIPELTSVTPLGTNFAFNYTATVANDERLDPVASSGATCPGPGNTLVQCTPPGTFFTIYDISGFVSAAVTASGWSETSQNVGITPSTINGTAFDSPTMPDVTFMYTGPIAAGSLTIPNFTIVSSNGGVNGGGHFTSQSTINIGPDTGDTTQQSGSVGVPLAPATTPEPDSFVLIATGLVLAVAGMYRRARA
jgi:hypothetical protein